MEYWTPHSETHPREQNSIRSTFTNDCSSYQKRFDHSFALLPSQIHASQPASWCHSQCSSFQTLCSHPTFWDSDWNQSNSPTCDLCDTDNVQNEQNVLFHCANPHVISLRTKYAFLLPPTGAQEMFTFLSQNNNKLYFFLHELIALYEQASSRTSWLRAFFL